jgi:membrane protein
MLMIGAAVLMPIVLQFIGLGSGFEWLIRIGSYVLLAFALLLGLAALYRFGPSRQQARWRWITPGAILATLAIMVVSLLFSWYAANFGNFDKTYGSLGGLIALLTWIWITVTAVIIGAELNSEAERQTEANVAANGEQKRSNSAASSPQNSAEWQAGFQAAQEKYRPQRSHSLGSMAVALPVSLALAALRSRPRK